MESKAHCVATGDLDKHHGYFDTSFICVIRMHLREIIITDEN